MLIEKYKDDLYRTVYAVLRNEKDAEDALQEVFLKIYSSLPSYEHSGFKTWMTRIAVNHAIDMKRKQSRRHEDAFETAEASFKKEAVDSIDLELIREEKRNMVRKKLEELPENYRDVIYGFYIEEKTYQQMAEEQNVQVKTIETKLYRARLWMKKHWKEDDF